MLSVSPRDKAFYSILKFFIFDLNVFISAILDGTESLDVKSCHIKMTTLIKSIRTKEKLENIKYLMFFSWIILEPARKVTGESILSKESRRTYRLKNLRWKQHT